MRKFRERLALVVAPWLRPMPVRNSMIVFDHTAGEAYEVDTGTASYQVSSVWRTYR